MSGRRGFVLLAGLAAFAASLAAQRAPVLQQVKVRHPYYFREMFIPQVTSGPSAVAWSPDGTELVYSMQGSLWRQRVGDTVARQLTDGPGYDYQPDWSPDGSRIVYASYWGDAIALRLLDPSTGASTPLADDGSVSLEPRWSPDGGRVAFTSTRCQGRWHVFIAAVTRDGRAERAERISEDRESGLPRYYYNAVDQFLSPTWSADGAELIVVSNRGHMWGSGSFWRMPARAGGTPREIRDEETTWKGKPEWSRDGRRVVYSLLGLRDHLLLPGYAGYATTAAASLSPTNAEIADLARAEGAVVGYVHPGLRRTRQCRLEQHRGARAHAGAHPAGARRVRAPAGGSSRAARRVPHARSVTPRPVLRSSHAVG